MLKVETATLISNCASLEEFGFSNKFLIPDKVPNNRHTQKVPENLWESSFLFRLLGRSAH